VKQHGRQQKPYLANISSALQVFSLVLLILLLLLFLYLLVLLSLKTVLTERFLGDKVVLASSAVFSTT